MTATSFAQALADRNIKSCIPGRANRKELIVHDPELYKRRNLIERLFDRIKAQACPAHCHTL